MGQVQGVLGVSVDQLGDPRARRPRSSWVGFLLESATQLVGSESLQCPLRVPSAALPASFHPLLSQCSGPGERDLGFLGSIPQPWALTCSHFPPRGESQARSCDSLSCDAAGEE